MNNSIVIIGHFSFNNNCIDGQTIKTKTLYDELSTQYEGDIFTVDTSLVKTRPIKFIYVFFKRIMQSRNIIVLASRRGRAYLFPFLYFAAVVFRKNVYHDLIGGSLYKDVEDNPFMRTFLNSFRENWVETKELKDRLDNLGIKNCRVIPNFKNLDLISKVTLSNNLEKHYCTFSRVIEEKGISIAIQAISRINSNTETKVYLDIFGPVEDSYKNTFQSLLEDNKGIVNYRGIIDYRKSVEILSKYDALLFPTFWSGEGFPGTILDAFSSGLPVICTDWNYNGELVIQGETGFLVKPKDVETLVSAIKKFNNLPSDKQLQLKRNCLDKAKEYQPDKWIKLIVGIISEK